MVACLSGTFGVLATLGVVGPLSTKQLLILLAVGIAKDGGLWLKQHPTIDDAPGEAKPAAKDNTQDAHE